MIHAIFLAALASIILIAWIGLLVAVLRLRRALQRERIRREEADAWAEDFEQQAAAQAVALGGLRARHATLTALYGEAVRSLLASNYVIIHRNVERQRRRPDSEKKE